MATIRKRGDKWQVQIRRLGHPARSRSFLSRIDALAWARQAEADIDRHGLAPDRKVLERVHLRDVLIRYRDTVISTKRCSPVETIIVNAILRWPLAKLSLAALSAAEIARYRDARLKQVQAVTVNRELRLIQHALTLASAEWGIPIFDNPAKGVRRPKVAPPRDRRLRPGELERLLAAFERCRNELIEPLARFAIETGMRQGELLRMRWCDWSPANRTLRIGVTKNGHPRTIPISSCAATILEQLCSGSVGRADQLVFPLSAEALKRCWRRATQRAALVDLHFHDLRHEAISRFFERGLNVSEVALISGHRDVRMLFRYTHPTAEAVAAKL